MRRRAFLRTATAAATCAMLAPIASARAVAAFGHAAPDAVRRIGEHYLSRYPGDRCRRSLAVGLGCAPGARWRDMCRALGPARRADFNAGRTLIVDGWIVAEAEGRLCAWSICPEDGAPC